MEDVDGEAFGSAQGAPGVGKLRDAFIENTGGAKSERAVDDVGVAGNPADVGHAPVDVLGMDVLVILGGAGDVGEISAGAVLATFGLAGGAAGIHQKKRCFGILRNWFYNLVAVIFQDIIHDVIAAHDHGRVGRIFCGIALPDENLFDCLAFFRGRVYGNVGAGLVVHPLAVAAVAVGINQHPAARIGGAQSAGFAAESAEYDRM